MPASQVNDKQLANRVRKRVNDYRRVISRSGAPKLQSCACWRRQQETSKQKRNCADWPAITTSSLTKLTPPSVKLQYGKSAATREK